MKKALKIIGIVLLVLILIAAGYVGYVFAKYERIEDKLPLEKETIGATASEVVVGQEYSIMTYNFGFGAYEPEFSFFMDGGESSWAKSEEGLKANVAAGGKFIASYDPDFLIMQEVDTNGTRTYHVNEFKMLQDEIGDGDYIFCMNYHSSFLMYPIFEPHGANESGLITYSDVSIDSSLRRSFPVSTSVKKILDLDRCYSITKIPVDNGKMLCIYDVHLSAYGTDDSVRAGQLGMLFEDMKTDYANGNYVICGGDFNHNLRDGNITDAPDWAQHFPKDQLPEGFNMAFDIFDDADVANDTCRNSDKPWTGEGSCLTVMVDGFIISDNIEVSKYQNIEADFKYSDHDPVIMNFILK